MFDWIRPYLPLTDLRELDRDALRSDVVAAVAVTVMSVPQGVAYALIAGLPPAMGLYAGALPAIFGALFRSSRHVVTGPTNALSLLVATSAAAQMDDPVAAAATLALLVGLLQLGAGLLKLGALVDYISTAVVTGYITGAGILIGVGQLPNVTGTPGGSGDLLSRLWGWAQGLHGVHVPSVVLGLGTVGIILLSRRFAPKGVGTLVAIGSGILLSWALDLGAMGVTTVRDLAPVPGSLPPLTIPGLQDVTTLLPVAVAAMVLSLVEASSVARSISQKTGQRLDISVEFTGQGLANLAAGFFGAYPVSGSLSRSALNHRVGAQTRLAGALSGVFMLGVLLLFGPVVDWTPIPSLAGLLLVVARDLVDTGLIKRLMRGGASDRLAFVGTVLGTWALPLDQAIYLGVAISIVLFLRRARLLVVRELEVDQNLRLRELASDEEPAARCEHIRVLHVEGPLFFGAANELQDALDRVLSDEQVEVLVVRLKRAQGLDYTTGEVLAATHARMLAEDRHLLLVGMRKDMLQRMEDIGVADTFGDDHLYPTEPGWFVAMNQALAHALDLVEHHCTDHTTESCPIARYVDRQEQRLQIVP